MPPKGKKGQDKGKSGEEERDEPLQAVVSYAIQCAYAANNTNLLDTCRPF